MEAGAALENTLIPRCRVVQSPPQSPFRILTTPVLALTRAIPQSLLPLHPIASRCPQSRELLRAGRLQGPLFLLPPNKPGARANIPTGIGPITAHWRAAPIPPTASPMFGL